jgi:hypothetical protein
METKHTPGPWKLDCFKHDFQIEAIGVRILRSHASDEDVDYRMKTSETGQQELANARLIAAAPDLLAVCEELLPALENAEADVDIWHALTAGSGIATLNRFREAIAKARGVVAAGA